MTLVLGKFYKGDDGEYDFAIAEDEKDGEGKKVVVFPEPGGQYDIHHHVPHGTNNGEFSS